MEEKAALGVKKECLLSTLSFLQDYLSGILPVSRLGAAVDS